MMLGIIVLASILKITKLTSTLLNEYARQFCNAFRPWPP